MIKKYGIVIAFVILGITNTFSQQTDTEKVLLPEISKSYKGDAKNGLADGKGTSKGEDTYTGEFKNGLPNGKGKYTYKNGNVFAGYFTEGLKNGKGVFTFSIGGNTMTQKGFWVKGDYVGTTNPEEYYDVSNISGIESYTIKKIDDTKDAIVISINRGSQTYIPTDFHINFTSGQTRPMGKKLMIVNYNYPVNCEVSFTIKKSGNIQECRFTFEIQKNGNYEVVINVS